MNNNTGNYNNSNNSRSYILNMTLMKNETTEIIQLIGNYLKLCKIEINDTEVRFKWRCCCFCW